MRNLIYVCILFALVGCGGGGGSPPVDPGPELGIVYITNNGTACFNCLSVYTDGELTDYGCGMDPLCPGETADTVVPLGHFYDVRMWDSTGTVVVDFPTFFMDSPTYTLVIIP